MLDTKTVQLWDTATGAPIGAPWQHANGPLTACFGPDGRQAFTLEVVSADPRALPHTELHVWDALQGGRLSPPQKLSGLLPQAPLSPDHRRVLTLSSDSQSLRLWDLATAQCLWTCTQGEVYLTAPQWSGDGSRLVLSAASITGRRANMVLDAATGEPLGQSFDPGEPGSWATALSPDGRRVLTSGQSNLVRVWDATTGRSIGRPLPHDAVVSQIQFSPDSGRVLTVSADEAVRVWSAAAGLPLTPLLKHQAPVSTAAFCPDGSQLLTVSGRVARTWPMSGTSPAGRRLGSVGPTPQAWLDPTGRYVLTLSGPKDNPQSATLWEVDTGRSRSLDLPTRSGPVEVTFSVDGRRLLIARNRRYVAEPGLPKADDVRVWDVTTGERTARIDCEGKCSEALLSPAGSRVFTPQGNGPARVWDAATGAPLTRPLQQSANGWVQAQFSPDGRRVLTATSPMPAPHDTTEVHIWDAATGAPCGTPIRPDSAHPNPGNPSGLYRIGFSPDAEQVLTVLQDSTCQLWDAATGKPVTPICQAVGAWSGGASYVGALSPEGRRVLVIGMDATGGGRAQVWDVGTGRAASRVLEHEIWLTHIEFSPDGSRVLTASGDGTARLWDAATGEPLTPPLRHPGEVRHAGFRADGRQIFTLCHRGPRDSPLAPNGLEVRVWDAGTGQQLTPTLVSYPYIQTDRSGDPHRYFARDGHRVLLVRADQSLEVRDFTADPRPVDELLAEAEVLSGRGISSGGSAQPVGDERFQARWEPLLGPTPAPDRPAWRRLLAWYREQAEAGLAPVPTESPKDATPRDPAAALWHAGRLLEVKPADGKARRLHAQAALALGLWNIAVADFEKILAAGGDDAPHHDLGVALAQLGKWLEAAQAFEHASQAPHASLESLLALARVRLFRGDDKGYREACALMLDRLAREAVPAEIMSRVMQVCAVGTLAADDTQRLVALMEMKYAAGAGWFGGRPGVHYRAGRYREAAELLQDSLTGEGANEVRTWFFLAMTHQCQRQQKEAQQTLALGLERWKQRSQAHGQEEPATVLRTWQERLDEQLLRREAERMVTSDR